MRRYRHGAAWAFWRWTFVEKAHRLYLRRLHLIKTPWFSVMLHWIKGPDPDNDLHDHPVPFVSFVLRGGYSERRADGIYYDFPRFSRNRKRATDQHRIVAVTPGTLTLVFAGRKVRDWGYHTEQGFVPWQEYQQ